MSEKYLIIENFEDLEKLWEINNYICYATLHGIGSNITLTAFLDENYYYESCIMFYGNNGDSTFENGYHWFNDSESPLSNKGWMIWGALGRGTGSTSWYPNDFNEEPDDKIEWYCDTYGNLSKTEIRDIKNKFILKDEGNILEKLNKLSINCPKGLLK